MSAVRERGVGLIEILVTVVILSLGFLAAARMQMEGVRFSRSAYHHSQAFFLASEMADRMRANPDGVRAGAYDGATTSAAAADPVCDACTPTELARRDVFQWSAALHPELIGADVVAALPEDDQGGPLGEILFDGPDRYRIRMSWPETVGRDRTVETLTTVLRVER